jgi:hypothetical protein
MASGLDDGPPSIWFGLQFGKIAATELIPLGGIVAEPFSQLRAGVRILGWPRPD